MAGREYGPARDSIMRLFVASICGLALAACESAPVRVEDGIEPKLVRASFETAPMTGVGDKADDPVLWVDYENPAQSLILGTNKDEGLHVYDMTGAERQMLPVGRLNNVDKRFGVAVASNDEANALSWFMQDKDSGEIRHVGDTPTGKMEPYGVCLGSVDFLVVAATYKDGEVQLWKAQMNDAGGVDAELGASVQFGSQLEGCVFDDANQRLFVGEEGVGVWAINLKGPDGEPVSVDTIAAGNGLVADVEGMSIWAGEDNTGYLVVSAQAADRFVVYDIQPPFAVRGVIRVVGDEAGTIDDVSHTDGLDVNSTPLPGFPRGVLIVQDDGNPKSGVDQNFKVVDWREVENALGLN